MRQKLTLTGNRLALVLDKRSWIAWESTPTLLSTCRPTARSLSCRRCVVVGASPSSRKSWPRLIAGAAASFDGSRNNVEPPDGCLRTDRRDLRDVFFQPQPADRHLEAILHAGIVGVQVAGEAAVLELQAVGILEVDRLGPVVVDHLGHLDALGDQLVALLFEPSLRARLEREVIERGGHAEPTSDPRGIVGRHARYPARFHEGDELVAPGIE